MGSTPQFLSWLNGGATVVVATATAVLAWREIARVREKRKSAEAEMSAVAYMLIQKVIEASPPDRSEFLHPQNDEERIRHASYVLDHLEGMESYLLRMMSLAPEAGDELEDRVQQVAGNLTSARTCYRMLAERDVSPTGAEEKYEDEAVGLAVKALNAESVLKRGGKFYAEALRVLELITAGKFRGSNINPLPDYGATSAE